MRTWIYYSRTCNHYNVCGISQSRVIRFGQYISCCMWDILIGKLYYHHICSFFEFALQGVCLCCYWWCRRLYVGILEEFCDVPCSSSHIRKLGPFRFLLTCSFFFFCYCGFCLKLMCHIYYYGLSVSWCLFLFVYFHD